MDQIETAPKQPKEVLKVEEQPTTARIEDLPYRIVGAAVLERQPVVLERPSKEETDYLEYLNSLEQKRLVLQKQAEDKRVEEQMKIRQKKSEEKG